MSCVPFVLLASAPAFASGSIDSMQQWQDYAASAVAPDFAWYTPQAAAPSLRNQVDAQASLGPELNSLAALRPRFAGVAWSDDSQRFGPQFSPFSLGSELSGRGVSASFTGTRLAWNGGAAGEFGMAAVVARQQYATQGFGAGEWDGSYDSSRRIGVGADTHESASGSGVRFDLRGGSFDWHWDVAVQSRIEMDPFKAYRGVYSEAGDFDIPGFAKLGLATPLSERFSIGAEVQRVFYREIDTFTSSSLPARFLSLLGDGSSPEFAWRDLTVYAIEARLADDYSGEWTLRFASQQQPRPTSALLDKALEELYSDSNVALSYQLTRVGLGQLRLAASYSPVTYFLGSSPYVRRGFETGSQLEFEAQWAVPF